MYYNTANFSRKALGQVFCSASDAAGMSFCDEREECYVSAGTLF